MLEQNTHRGGQPLWICLNQTCTFGLKAGGGYMEMSQLCANFLQLPPSFHFALTWRLPRVSSCSALYRFAPICDSVDATSQTPNFSLFRCRADPQQTLLPSSSTCHLLFCFLPMCHSHPLGNGTWLQPLHSNDKWNRGWDSMKEVLQRWLSKYYLKKEGKENPAKGKVFEGFLLLLPKSFPPFRVEAESSCVCLNQPEHLHGRSCERVWGYFFGNSQSKKKQLYCMQARVHCCWQPNLFLPEHCIFVYPH